MSEENRWPGLNDKPIVAEMLRNPLSEHWTSCQEFIKRLIDQLCFDLPPDLREDAVQETMTSIHIGLLGFRFESRLTTWLTSIARNRTIDIKRRHTSIITQEIHVQNTPEDDEENREPFQEGFSRTPEDEFLTNENLIEVIREIEAFIKKHKKSVRNRQILQMVLFEGYSAEETARKLEIHAPVVSHVVRSARRHLKVWMSRRSPPSSHGSSTSS